MLSLYAYAFGSYGATFLPPAMQPLGKHLLISAAVILLTLLNAIGSRTVGEAEEWIVGLKIAILLVFIGFGLSSVSYQRIKPASWAPIPQLVAGGMVIFLAYEGFELIANAARDVKNAASVLPRAYYASALFVIGLYVLISLVTVGTLPADRIVAARDYALAEGAKPFLGRFGFTLIAVTALLSTASAINATLYGTARVSYIIAKDGELPQILEKKIWNRPLEGLVVTSGLTLLVANLLDLSSISMMGSAGFLLIFSVVNAGNVRLRKQTNSSGWLAAMGALACSAALATLLWQRAKVAPKELWTLVVIVSLSVVIEATYRKAAGRVMRPSFIEITKSKRLIPFEAEHEGHKFLED